jgi:hypothetical protein
MKESKFIELLNLYIDQQISPEDAALLEEEILQNPRRRQTYNQYCRMHRACTLALDRYNTQDESEDQVARVVAFERPRRVKWGHYAAGLAAAACLGFVAVQTALRPGRAPSSSVATAQQSRQALVKSEAALVMTPVRMGAPSVRALSKTEWYIAQRLRSVAPMTAPTYRISLAAFDFRSALISPLQAPAVHANARPSIEDFVFAHEPATPESPRIFRVRQSTDDRTENMAIEFRRD